jgi:predicted O-methyltransferase YrrM
MSMQWNPGKLLEVSGYYWQSCTLHAAVVLEVFTLLGQRRLSADEIARMLQGDPRGVTMLLNALVAMGLLLKADGRYANDPAARRWLVKDSPEYIGHMIKHHHHLADSWVHLDQAVKSGRPVRERLAAAGPQRRESFLMGMFNQAMLLAPRLVAQISLAGRRRLLDLGGGPGTYAIEFCRANPDLRATVFDLPTTRPFAEATIASFGLGERIEFQEGDYLQAAPRGRFDVAWLSHILHGEGPHACRKIIARAAGALEPGGAIFIHDFILDDTMDGPLFPALFALNMLCGTPSGQAYSQGQISGMLTEAGVDGIERLAVDAPNSSGVICGVIKGSPQV